MSVNISYKKQAGFFLISIIILLAVVEGSARAYEYVGQDCNLAEAETLTNVDFFSKLQKYLEKIICLTQEREINEKNYNSLDN